MSEKKDTQIPLKIFNFNQAYEPPVYKYDKKLNIISWGSKNLYPDYIINLYNNAGSTTHKSIVNKKVKLTAGKGFVESDNEALNLFLKENDIAEATKRASLDLELFNGFAYEVVWSNDGKTIASLQHLPLHKLRIGIEDEDIPYPHVWYSNDWSQHKKEGYEPEMIPLFDADKTKGKQVFVFTEYNPSADGLYPIACYSTSMNWIELDYEVSKFHLNQVKQGYAPSFLLNFSTGIPTEEEQDMFFKEFKKNFSGSENAGKIILTYSDGTDQKPELIPIALNDSDDRFTLLQETVERNIVMAHEIPAAMALLVPGKLGSTTEREELLVEFQQSYITPRQESLELVLNKILSAGGYQEDVQLQTYIETNEEEVVIDDKQADAQAQLKGSVGGVQGIIQIQQSVASGLTDRDSAQALLELIYGFSPEDSVRLLGNVQEGDADNIDETNTI